MFEIQCETNSLNTIKGPSLQRMTADKNTFCVLPFIHLETRTEGTLSPCCISREKIPKNRNELFHLSEDGMFDAFNSPYMKELRQALRSGQQHRNCEVCWMEERAGATSKRQRENERFQALARNFSLSNIDPDAPIFLDLKLGNTCNLKCRICGPNNSSKWLEENLRNHGNDFLERPTERLKSLQPDQSRKEIVQWPQFAPLFWKELETWLPRIERFEIFGGEPFLNKKHMEILKQSVSFGYSKQQSIHYNTNGTVYPRELIEEILPKFQSVSLLVSIDGIKDRFEYQRFPASFDVVLENLKKFKTAGLEPQVCLTISKLTLPTILEDLEFWSQLGFPVFLNFLYEPDFLDIRTFSEAAKDKISKTILESPQVAGNHERLVSVIKHMNSEKWPDKDKQFLNFLESLDSVRGQSFRKVFPNLLGLIQG